MEQENKNNEMFEDKNLDKKDKNMNENKENEKETITLTQEDYDNIKLQVADAMNDYKDLERDFENYRSRLKDEVEKSKFEGVSDAVKTILPALDSFKKAKKIVQDKATLSGINLIEKNVLSALNSLGIKKIDCVGKVFDPNFHNAVMMMQKEHTKSGIVIDEVEAGYMLFGKVIKYSQVVVAK